MRYQIAIYYIMSITRDQFQLCWVSSGRFKKQSRITILKKNKFAIGCQKNAIQSNMIQQYPYHGNLI